MRIAALIKQIPKFEAMRFGAGGRIVREGLELEMNAYCRRAVSKAVELAAATGGSCTVFTLGPPAAEDVLREAVAWGADEGVLISDPAFAGSDTLATARALAAALRREGPFDLVLMGRNSVDSDTGQVPPELAELLDLPFATGVKELELGEGEVRVGCEHDDEWVEAVVRLPAILSCAERLTEPSKKSPEARAAVPASRIRVLTAADLGAGPWGQAGSPTTVGDVEIMEVERQGNILEGSVEEQVAEAVRLLAERGALAVDAGGAGERVARSLVRLSPTVGVVVEPGRARAVRELLGTAARLAAEIQGRVVALAPERFDAVNLGSWGADAIVVFAGVEAEEDLAAGVAQWAGDEKPWAILATGTSSGREVASRIAARLGAGLTGDAVGLEIEAGRLVAWKPAFGGRMVAAIHCSSPTQMATVRAGVLPTLEPRDGAEPVLSVRPVEPRRRVRVVERKREDDSGLLANARRVIAVGMGVKPDAYPAFERLARLLDGELAATRKVTDRAWMPRARQVGITGHSISPQLFIAVGASGKFNFMVGSRQAGTILAVNPDRDALIWEWVDIGIVGAWDEVLPHLERELRLAMLGR